MNLTTYDRRMVLVDISYRLRYALNRSEFAKQNYLFASSQVMICDIFGCVAGLQVKEEYWPILGNAWGDIDPMFWEMFDLADVISAD